MTARRCAASVTALLLLGVFWVAVVWSNDIDPCRPDCRVRFADVEGIR